MGRSIKFMEEVNCKTAGSEDELENRFDNNLRTS